MNHTKYPIGIQTFSVLREGGYVYANKALLSSCLN